MTHEELDLSKETSDARLFVIVAAGFWIVALITHLIGQYAPLGKFAHGFLIFSAVCILAGVVHTAYAVFHGSTVLVMRVRAAWRNPIQIAIALLAPAILSFYFLQDGLPQWSSIEDMLVWWTCIPLLLIAFVSLKCSSMLDKVVPMRGFLISASAPFIPCVAYSVILDSTALETTGQPIWKARFFVIYLVCVAVSYGAMCFHFFKRTRGNHGRGTQLSLWD